MITAAKPELNEELLAHFGVKGMRWGQRKAETSGQEANPKVSTKKKVAIGAAGLAVGAAAVAGILTRRGKVPITELSRKARFYKKLAAAKKVFAPTNKPNPKMSTPMVLLSFSKNPMHWVDTLT